MTKTCLLACTLLAACARPDTPPPTLRTSGEAMGTKWHLTLATANPQAGPGVAAAIENIEALASNWRPDTPVSRFNARISTEPMEIPADLADIVALSLEISRASDGAFDITVAPLVRLWGYGPNPADGTPASGEIAAALEVTGYQHLQLTRRGPSCQLSKDTPGVEIDLSGIAKGYAVDAAADALDGLGISDFMIELGGELRARGHNPAGEPWTIGIESPQPDAIGKLRKVIAPGDAAVATSGTYRQFHPDGHTHIIDPRTGRPLEVPPHRAITVVAPTAALADALATALLVMDPAAGAALAKRFGARLE